MLKIFFNKFTFFVALVVFFLYNQNASEQKLASASTTENIPEYQIDNEAMTEIDDIKASALVVFDVETGEVLFERNANQKLPIASITKLVTAYSVYENFNLEYKATILKEDVNTFGRAGKLEEGQVYAYRELILPMLLESSNDASAVFERGGVIDKMNLFVSGIGATDTFFADASGLSAQNVSTASDLALITTYLHHNRPNIFDITKLKKYIGSYTGWVNNNPVLASDYLGGKHGYTKAAGKTIVSIFEEDLGGSSREIGYVLLGSTDTKDDIATLRDVVDRSVSLK